MPAFTWLHRAAVAVAVLAACSGSTEPEPLPIGDFTFEMVGGDGQTAIVGDRLGFPLSVRVTSVSPPASGRTVEWTASGGAGTISAGGTTNTLGIATATFQVGSAGTHTITARLAGETASVTFSVTGVTNHAPSLVYEKTSAPVTNMHDTYVRDGIAFVSAWDQGLVLYDVGNGIRGGTPANPVEISRVLTAANGVAGGRAVHNAWWFHNPVTNERRYVFVGQEGPGVLGVSSSGDIHVVDVSDLTQPTEVAYVTIPGAGTHNFWMDEARQILYAGYYNAGVVAIDVSGTLTGNISSRIVHQVRPGGNNNTYVWGVHLAGGSLWASDILSGFWELDPVTLQTRSGGNNVPDRYSTDLWVHGSYAYTGTLSGRGPSATMIINVWKIDGTAPVLVDSVSLPEAGIVSDLQVTDDGTLLVATSHGSSSGLVVFSLARPERPAIIGRTTSPVSIHTGEVETIGGKYYVFTRTTGPVSGWQIWEVFPP
jgi:hypothetical protein